MSEAEKCRNLMTELYPFEEKEYNDILQSCYRVAHSGLCSACVPMVHDKVKLKLEKEGFRIHKCHSSIFRWSDIYYKVAWDWDFDY
jgi:hypothetical protein